MIIFCWFINFLSKIVLNIFTLKKLINQFLRIPKLKVSDVVETTNVKTEAVIFSKPRPRSRSTNFETLGLRPRPETIETETEKFYKNIVHY